MPRTRTQRVMQELGYIRDDGHTLIPQPHLSLNPIGPAPPPNAYPLSPASIENVCDVTIALSSAAR